MSTYRKKYIILLKRDFKIHDTLIANAKRTVIQLVQEL